VNAPFAGVNGKEWQQVIPKSGESKIEMVFREQINRKFGLSKRENGALKQRVCKPGFSAGVNLPPSWRYSIDYALRRER
jgi:hypothetical protein